MTTCNIIFAGLLVNAAEVFQFTHAWRIQFSNKFGAYVFVCLVYPFTISYRSPQTVKCFDACNAHCKFNSTHLVDSIKYNTRSSSFKFVWKLFTFSPFEMQCECKNQLFPIFNEFWHMAHTCCTNTQNVIQCTERNADNSKCFIHIASGFLSTGGDDNVFDVDFWMGTMLVIYLGDELQLPSFLSLNFILIQAISNSHHQITALLFEINCKIYWEKWSLIGRKNKHALYIQFYWRNTKFSVSEFMPIFNSIALAYSI